MRATYWAQSEFLLLERFFRDPVIAPMVEEVDRVRPAINRKYIPRHKKGGSVSACTLRAGARDHHALRVAGAPRVRPRGDARVRAVGLVERSTARLVCQLYKGERSRSVRELSVSTDPGTLVLFNGDRLWHAITPLGEHEERVSLTLEYVTDPGMTPIKRFMSNMKDAVAYFGFRAVFGRRGPWPPTRSEAAGRSPGDGR